MSPLLSDTTMILPFSKPLIAASSETIGAPCRAGSSAYLLSTDQLLAVCASKSCKRPSTERMTTTFSPIAGANSSSEFTRDRHGSARWRRRVQ